jgi:hypothetical protein
MEPEIDGPFRGWYGGQRHLSIKRDFTESDIVWWRQSDHGDLPGFPGGNIDEVASRWWFDPVGVPALHVLYQTYLGERYGKFIFPASFLDNGQYVIWCNIVNKNNDVLQRSWVVNVLKPGNFQI